MRDVKKFATAVYDALTKGETPLVSVALGWAALEKSSGAVPAYGCRMVLNAEEIRAHYVAAGVPEEALVPADEMHVTIIYSSRAFYVEDDWCCCGYPTWTTVIRGGNRFTRLLGREDGDEKALVLTLDSTELVSEWNYFRSMGAGWDFDSFVPHVSVSYDYAGTADVPPFAGDVVLGPLLVMPLLDEDALEKKFPLRDDAESAILKSVQILRTDEEQRVVWGWVSVATEKGEKVFDSHGDHIPMAELEKASVDFMLTSRVGKAMHVGEKVSDVIGCLPLSSELAKALGIECEREGLIMGFRVNDDRVWEAVKKGELGAFSIGGTGILVDA